MTIASRGPKVKMSILNRQQHSSVLYLETIRCIIVGCRDFEPVLHRSIHGRDAAQGLQSRRAGLPHVAVQPVRLFRRAVQYRRGHLQLQRRHAGARRQRPAMRQTAASLQGNAVLQPTISHTPFYDHF